MSPTPHPRYDAPPGSPASPRERILVVDDEPSVARLIVTYLQTAGFEAESVGEGSAALERLAVGGISLLLLDMQLPDCSGLEVLRSLRESPSLSRLPVIALTGQFHDTESEREGLESGADEYLHKPVDRRSLLSRVRSLLRLADAERHRALVAQLAHAEKLGALGQVAAGLAHELHNPIGALLANLRALKAQLGTARGGPRAAPPLTAAEIDELLDETVSCGERACAVTSALRTFAGRLSTGAPAEPVDLARVCEAALSLLRPGLSPSVRVTDDLRSADVLSRPAELHQLVLNLLINACQSVEGRAEAGSVSVATRVERCDVVLTVADSGVGIAREHLPRIFDPFFTTRSPGRGVGMGLSVCLSIVRGLGGTIHVASEPGRGATFVVRLPLAPAARPALEG